MHTWISLITWDPHLVLQGLKIGPTLGFVERFGEPFLCFVILEVTRATANVSLSSIWFRETY